VLEDDTALDPAELVAYLTPRMPRHWLPRFVEFSPGFPRTESFKVRKADLRDAGVTAATWDRVAAIRELSREAR
jgi:crotonobetaine/carnitine-CoA ligase